MKKFKFHLEGYLKVKKVKEQQKLGELAQVMGKVNVYRERQQAFDSEYNSMLQAQRTEFVSKPVPITDLRNMYEYLGALRLRKDTATRQIAELEPELAAKRDAYNSARKERRVIEIMRERRFADFKAAVEKEEMQFFDEANQLRRKTP
ncbi:flagellar export protein FliJ [Turneriella parva]|uniref:Flagellar FliJ protein n=1 Tax=Turneriella parva (strain ATCC BAA-1111 / DSM 21527 / NCTC 11395 / H) TaxID=869212 RepID=I4BBK2_TURPD|nr:flagellar export protein FliJ [Turneriella parva]AFM14659.1 flagellar export protein FliJ [Turneriella parva DSM 21527]